MKEEDALHRVETIVSRMEHLLRSPDIQSRDWTEEIDLMAKCLKQWTLMLKRAAKTDWNIHLGELKVQYGQWPSRRKPLDGVLVDTSGDGFPSDFIRPIGKDV
jgi:hypothetical protein